MNEQLYVNIARSKSCNNKLNIDLLLLSTKKSRATYVYTIYILHTIYTIFANFDVDKTDSSCIITLYYDSERSSSRKIRIRANSKSSKTIKPFPTITNTITLDNQRKFLRLKIKKTSSSQHYILIPIIIILMFQLSENNFFSSSVAVHEERNDEKIFLVIQRQYVDPAKVALSSRTIRRAHVSMVSETSR